MRLNTRAKVFVLVRERGSVGCTVDEAEIALAMPHQSVSPRFVELAKGGWIRDGGQRRFTRWGKEAAVYVAVEIPAKIPPPPPPKVR